MMNNRVFNKAINLVFVCHRPAVWDALKSIFESCLSDENFNLFIIAIPKKNPLPKLGYSHEIYETEGAEEFFKDFPCKVINGYNYKTKEWFDLKSLNPDYIFFQQPYNCCLPNQYNSEKVSKYSKILYISYAANILGNGILEDCSPIDFFKNISMIFTADKYYDKLIRTYLHTIKANPKVYLTGYPKYDDLEKYKNIDSNNWNLSRKDDVKRIVWTPRWCTNEGNCNFFEYKDKLLDYAEKNLDIDFIFRPHPQLFSELNTTGELPEKEANEYKDRYEKLPNAKIDKQKEYLSTFYSSDFMITDISSVIADYFLTGKPIIYCHKKDYFNEFSRKLSEGFYWVHSWQELKNTIEMLKNGNDPLKEKRQEIIKNEFYIPNEKVGFTIKELIKKDFYTNQNIINKFLRFIWRLYGKN